MTEVECLNEGIVNKVFTKNNFPHGLPQCRIFSRPRRPGTADMNGTDSGNTISSLKNQELKYLPSVEPTSASRSIAVSPWKRRLRQYGAPVTYLTLYFLYTVYVVFSLIYDPAGAIFVSLLEAIFLFIVISKVFKVDIWSPLVSLQSKCLLRVKKPFRSKIRM